MPKYYVMNCMAGVGPLQFMMEVDWSAKKYWFMGRRFSIEDDDMDFQPPSESIEITTDIDSKVRERVYPELTWDPIPLMTQRLVKALQSAGVDNLQIYRTTLIDPPSSASPPEDLYVAVNILGLVAAADLAHSEANPAVSEQQFSKDFHSLAIDPTKARDRLLFRLEENVGAVMAHERVRRHIEAAGIDTLTWFAPESWAGY